MCVISAGMLKDLKFAIISQSALCNAAPDDVTFGLLCWWKCGLVPQKVLFAP